MTTIPWETPTLKTVRGLVRDNVQAYLPGADALVPNSALRVMSDVQGGLCFLNLEYLDWLALQLMPDTAEVEWLDRHASIWLSNADGSTGRKLATPAQGSIIVTGISGIIIPAGSQYAYSTTVTFQTLDDVTINGGAVPVDAIAIDPGSAGNVEPGSTLNPVSTPPGVGTASVITMAGGTDQETDDELRARVLARIRNPPQGGDAADYCQWALAVPGVTRAWCAPLEMGIGTVTTRFMMDDVRADNGGFPTADDVATVAAYLDTVRPVAVKDFFVVAPIPRPINFTISGLVTDNEATRAAIQASAQAMILEKASPGATIWTAWVSAAILAAAGVNYFELTMDDAVMPNLGAMAVLGDITYV